VRRLAAAFAVLLTPRSNDLEDGPSFPRPFEKAWVLTAERHLRFSLLHTHLPPSHERARTYSVSTQKNFVIPTGVADFLFRSRFANVG
jgi:hypothetical protein